MSLLARLAERRIRDIQSTAGACSGALTSRCRGDAAELVVLPNGERRWACPVCQEAARAMGLELVSPLPAWRRNDLRRDYSGAIYGRGAA